MDAPTEITPGVHRLGTSWVNWYLVEEAGRWTAVDAAVAGYADTLEQDLASVGAAPGDIDALVLTHADADHTGLAGRLSEDLEDDATRSASSSASPCPGRDSNPQAPRGSRF